MIIDGVIIASGVPTRKRNSYARVRHLHGKGEKVPRVEIYISVETEKFPFRRNEPFTFFVDTNLCKFGLKQHSGLTGRPFVFGKHKMSYTFRIPIESFKTNARFFYDMIIKNDVMNFQLLFSEDEIVFVRQ